MATPEVRVEDTSEPRRAKTGVMKVAGASSVTRPRNEHDVSAVTATSAMRSFLAMLPVVAPNTAVRSQATGGFQRSQTPQPRVEQTLAPPETDVPRRPSSAPPTEPERVVDASTGAVVAESALLATTSDSEAAAPPTRAKRQFARNTRT